MTTHKDEIVERLRRLLPTYSITGYSDFGLVNPDGPEAADLIEQMEEALRAIIDRAPERDVKWAGMTPRDIAFAALTNKERMA